MLITVGVSAMSTAQVRAQFDHLVVAIRSLPESMAEFERTTGVKPVVGGTHPGRGTENALVSLGGGKYLEIADANDSVDANMTEGFEQPSDAAFANFVFIAKGSVAEVIARMKSARRKQQITDEQLAKVIKLGEPLGKMMGGFIKYLAAPGFPARGRHSVAPTPRRPTKPHH